MFCHHQIECSTQINMQRFKCFFQSFQIEILSIINPAVRIKNRVFALNFGELIAQLKWQRNQIFRDTGRPSSFDV